MDIKLPDSTLRKYLSTKASPEKIMEALTLCGPSVDRLNQVENDYVYEIEAITNRVDTASAFGFAREASAILPLFGIPAKLINSPYDIKSTDLLERKTNKLPLEIKILDQDLVSHLSAIVLDNIVVGPSPKEIASQITISGSRPINNLVDVTNYLTLCFGQPVHIFDYDKIGGHKMILRTSKPSEKVQTLDGRNHELLGGDIVIEDGDGRLIDLCGIMGGKLSEVDENTKRAVLFVQTYQPKKIRRTSLYTQERTLAAQIFEKNPDSKLVVPTLIEGVRLLNLYANARVAGDSIDIYTAKPEPKTLKLDLKWLNNLIGIKFDVVTVISILKDLGFDISKKTDLQLEVKVPTWRLHDISIPEDLAEEVARVYGYFRLEGKLPLVPNLSYSTNSLLNWEYLAKKYLADIGFTEIFNYSLISQDLYQKSGISSDHSISLKNPLTIEFEHMRRSLIPSLLMDLENNQGKIDLPMRIFELSNIYIANEHAADKLPEERSILALGTQGLDFRTSKGYLEALFKQLHLKNINFTSHDDNLGPWQKNQTAQIYSDNHFLGMFGPIKTLVKANFNLKGEVYLANLDFQTIANLSNTESIYNPISEFPDFIEDITIESKLYISELIQLIKQENSLITKVIYKESFQNRHTFTIHFNDSTKNLSQDEVNVLKTKLLKIS